MQSFPCHFNELCLKALFKQKPQCPMAFQLKKVNICNRHTAVTSQTLARVFISFYATLPEAGTHQLLWLTPKSELSVLVFSFLLTGSSEQARWRLQSELQSQEITLDSLATQVSKTPRKNQFGIFTVRTFQNSSFTKYF